MISITSTEEAVKPAVNIPRLTGLSLLINTASANNIIKLITKNTFRLMLNWLTQNNSWFKYDTGLKSVLIPASLEIFDNM